MPIVLLKPYTKIAPEFYYPSRGSIELNLESTHPCDVYVVPADQSKFIDSRGARIRRFWEAHNKMNIDRERISLSKSSGSEFWRLVIGNPNNETIGVYYKIYNV